MTKQQQHIRKYRSGKVSAVNKGIHKNIRRTVKEKSTGFSGRFMNNTAYVAMDKGDFYISTDWFTFDHQTLFDVAVYFRELFDDKDFMIELKPYLKECVKATRDEKEYTITQSIESDVSDHLGSRVSEEMDMMAEDGENEKDINDYEKRCYKIDVDDCIKKAYFKAKKDFLEKMKKGLDYALENPMENDWTDSRNWNNSVTFNAFSFVDEKL